MKLASSATSVRPRPARRPEVTGDNVSSFRQLRDEVTIAPHTQFGWQERALDAAHSVHHALEGLSLEDTVYCKGMAGIVGAGALALGTKQLRDADCLLDRVEGVGHLALAAESFCGLSEHLHHSPLATGLGLLHGATDIVSGAGQILGAKDENTVKLAGACQVIAGLASTTGAIFPALHAPAALTIAGVLTARQAIIVAHENRYSP